MRINISKEAVVNVAKTVGGFVVSGWVLWAVGLISYLRWR